MGNSDVSSFKRPLNDGYPKREMDPPSRSASGYEQRGGVSSIGSSGKDHRFNDSVDNRANFGRNRVDDRDTRFVI